jgi:hypothetical protein
MKETTMKIRLPMVRAGAVVVTCVALAAVHAGCSNKTTRPGDSHPGDERVAVTTCDGQGEAMVQKGAGGQVLADALMDQWKRDHPERDWVAAEKERHELKPPADNSALLVGAQARGHTYGQVTERDLLVWARETEKFALEGSRVFHSSELLGSAVGVSCDMCHPHASNTHPETYPKFQAQLGRAVLLRDMINWCIENPVRGHRLEADDARMRALEAYILAQRSGTEMVYGKH